MNRSVQGLLALIVCSALIASAWGETPREPSAEPDRDYSRGFETLRNLGLPDVTYATYVKLTGGHKEVYQGSERHGFHLGELSGRAWLLGTREHGAAVVVPVDGTGLLNVTNLDVFARERTASPRKDPTEERRLHLARWTPADPHNDFQAVTNRLSQLKGSGEAFGRYLIVAAHFHRAGF